MNIKVHKYTYYLFLLWFLQSLHKGIIGAILDTFLLLTIFLCVIVHELSHGYIAKRFGREIKKITILPLGAAIDVGDISKIPKQEILISIAGPISNFIVALVIYSIYTFPEFSLTIFPEVITIYSFMYSLFLTNIFLGLFNLIPALPIDGGRILRGTMSLFLEHKLSTKIACSLSMILSFSGFIFGIFNNWYLVGICVLIFACAYSERYEIISEEKLIVRKKKWEEEQEKLNIAISERLKREKKEEKEEGILIINTKFEGRLKFKAKKMSNLESFKIKRHEKYGWVVLRKKNNNLYNLYYKKGKPIVINEWEQSKAFNPENKNNNNSYNPGFHIFLYKKHAEIYKRVYNYESNLVIKKVLFNEIITTGFETYILFSDLFNTNPEGTKIPIIVTNYRKVLP